MACIRGLVLVCLSFARCVGLFNMVGLPVGMRLLLYRADASFLSFRGGAVRFSFL